MSISENIEEAKEMIDDSLHQKKEESEENPTKADIEELIGRVENLENKLDDSPSERISELSSKLDELEESRVSESDFKELQQEVKNQEEEKIESLKQKIQDIESEKKETRDDRIQKIEEKLSKEEKSIHDLQEKIKELEEELEKQGNEVKLAEPSDDIFVEGELDKIKKLESRVAELEDELSEHEADKAASTEELNSRLEELELEVQNQSLHEKASRKRMEKLEEKIEDMETPNNAERRINELQQQVDKLSTSLEDRVDQKAEQSTEGFRKELDIVEDEMNDLASQLAQLSDIVVKELKKD